MAEFILDLPAGDVKSFSVSKAISVPLQEPIWISRGPSVEGPQTEMTLISACVR